MFPSGLFCLTSGIIFFVIVRLDRTTHAIIYLASITKWVAPSDQDPGVKSGNDEEKYVAGFALTFKRRNHRHMVGRAFPASGFAEKLNAA